MDQRELTGFVDSTWDQAIVPALQEYIRIPNKSPAFDPAWREHGHMERAVKLIAAWCQARAIEGMKLEVVRLKGDDGKDRTPVILLEIPATAGVKDTVLLYGHLDKQPEFAGWNAGLGPWEPVLRDGKLYGRGGADDGYAAFASLTAIEALRRQKIPHARCVVLIEACEESGSYDLPAYIDHLAARIGDVSLVVCLDSGCGDYDRLWSTTSLRGLVGGTLSVETLREGVHSGDASGIVPSTFRVMRQVLARIEDADTGRVLTKDLWTKIPKQRQAQAKATAKILKKDVYAKFPWHDGVKPVSKDLLELMLNRTWRPALSITGARGFPDVDVAGNVLRPLSAVKISMRIPPSVDAKTASKKLKKVLEKNPPYGAKVTFAADKASEGWNAPALATWLEDSLARASKQHFGKPAAYMGEGGSIPFMGMLGKKFPKAQFCITGVLGPHSNAHGPNEFLHLATGKRLTACVAQVVADHAARAR